MALPSIGSIARIIQNLRVGPAYASGGSEIDSAGNAAFAAEVTCATLNATTTKVVVGPSSPTDGRLALFDGTTGRLLKQAVIGCDGSGNLTGVGTVACGALTATGQVIGKGTTSQHALRRNTATNNAELGSMAVQANLTTGTIADGFGPMLDFSHLTADASEVLIGRLGYVRSGAANTADFKAYTINAGSAVLALKMLANGAVILPAIRAVSATGGATAPEPAHGTYTPTITGVANIDSSTAFLCRTIRQGNNVLITGYFEFNATTNGATTTIDLSTPVSSNFGAATDVQGSAVAYGVAVANGIEVYANTANDRIQFHLTAGSNGSHYVHFAVMMTVI